MRVPGTLEKKSRGVEVVYPEHETHVLRTNRAKASQEIGRVLIKNGWDKGSVADMTREILNAIGFIW